MICVHCVRCSKFLRVSSIGVADTFWLFIFMLNRAKYWFNSIFNSKLNQKYSFKKLFIQIGKINSKNYSIQNWIKNIHSNWKNNLSLRKQWKTCKMGRFFPQNAMMATAHLHLVDNFPFQGYQGWICQECHEKSFHREPSQLTLVTPCSFLSSYWHRWLIYS